VAGEVRDLTNSVFGSILCGEERKESVMWKPYERPKREYRKNLYAAININRGGMFLNHLACDMIGMKAPEDTRFFRFHTDEKDKNRFGFQVLLNTQQYARDLYKVKYRDENKTAKINAKQFVITYRLLERALKLEQTTFPLMKEGEDFYYFELK